MWNRGTRWELSWSLFCPFCRSDIYMNTYMNTWIHQSLKAIISFGQLCSWTHVQWTIVGMDDCLDGRLSGQWLFSSPKVRRPSEENLQENEEEKEYWKSTILYSIWEYQELEGGAHLIQPCCGFFLLFGLISSSVFSFAIEFLMDFFRF